MMLTCTFEHFKVPLDGQTSLKSTLFDEFTFERVDGKTARPHGQSGPRDEVH